MIVQEGSILKSLEKIYVSAEGCMTCTTPFDFDFAYYLPNLGGDPLNKMGLKLKKFRMFPSA